MTLGMMRNLSLQRREVMMMSDARKATTTLQFNGKNVDTSLKEYLESVTYTDVASGSSDTLAISLQNIDEKWMKGWYPKKGDVVKGGIKFLDWDQEGQDKKLSCGSFTLDEIKFSGNPMTASFSCVSSPASESFKTRERTKTWKNVTIQGIAKEIAKRYSLKLSYSGPSIKINSLEQSQPDSQFLYSLCESYGLSMKVYKNKIVIYDQTTMEKKKAVRTLKMTDFVDNDWDLTDSLYGVYTGARIFYKSSKDSKEISVYTGLKAEKAKGSRVLKINETADSVSDAYYKAAAKVNKSNESATTISGSIWPNPKICAGVTITISGFGRVDGKYFVDKSTLDVGSGTKQKIEIHKCQKRLIYKPKKQAAKAAPAKKEYKKGDIVNFHGGTHYVSSYAGAKGYSARAGQAKITLDKTCKGNGGAHPYHLVHTNSASNVYGWVDEGTFD